MAATRRAPLALDTYDPFGASSSSFLPPMGLFSPVAPSPASSRPTPGFCATIFEEEDQEELNDASSSTSTIVPADQRRPSAFSIHPRILRSDSCSDDDSDIPPVLRFPVPPSTIPSSSPFPNRSPPKHLPALKPVSIPPPQPQLKSCFEDDDDDDDFVAPSPVVESASRRTSPTRLTASRPAPAPPSKPFSLLKKATSALKSTSPPRSPSSKPTTAAPSEKPLPRAPHPQRPRITPTPYEEQPISVSPTPSLSSSSSGSDCSSSTMPYIPVGSIIPAPAVVQDLDEYLETLEMYFPSELWEEQPHELRRQPNSAAAKSRPSAAHRKRPSAESSSSSCSRSSSDENLGRRSRKSSVDDAVVDVQKLLKNSASSGDMKLASYTSTSSTSVRVSSPLSPPAEIRSHSRSGSDSPTSTAYSSSPSNSSSTVTPGSRTPSPTFAKHASASAAPKSILKPSKSSPLLRDRSTSVSSTMSCASPPPVPRSSSRSSNYNSPMSPTRGRAPVPMQLFAR